MKTHSPRDGMFRLTIQRKVFLATFALATALSLLLVLAMRWNLGQGFERYTTAAEFGRLNWIVANIEREYAAHGNWDFVRAAPREAWQRFQRRPQQPGNPDWPPGGRPPPPWENGPPPRQGPAGPPQGYTRPDFAPPRQPGAGDTLGIGPRLALVDMDGKRLAGNAAGKPAGERPIMAGGAVVGHLTLQAAPSAAGHLDAAFLASQTQNMLLAGLAALGLSLLAAWVLARHLLAPIRSLTAGAQRVADGWLDARIPVRSRDELGELAENFNAMAERLVRQEESRRTWISETSHELRTPLAVLRAEIEALQDGVREPDATTLARLHKQVEQLTKLVDDLRLTLDRTPAAAIERLPLSPLAVLDETLDSFRERFAAADIAVDTAGLEDAGWIVRGDAGRLIQVFGNLLENTLRYTRPGGRLRIAANAARKRLTIRFDDTAPAPPPEALPHLFERFFRAEPSRSRALGGSGLGLAICRNLVEAHGGRISADFSELGGLAVRIELPLDHP